MHKNILLKTLQIVFYTCIVFSCTDGDEEQLQIDITSDTKKIYESQGVNFALTNPDIVSEASWFFEGGEPEYFNEVNPPTVYYGKEGTYSVTLNAIVNGQKQVINKEKLITVLVEPNGKFNYVSINSEKEEIYSGESVEVWVTAYGDNLQYEWSANTGQIKGEGPKVTFEANFCFEGEAEVSAHVSNEYGSMERTIKITIIRKMPDQ
jgi:PKD repeat protein